MAYRSSNRAAFVAGRAWLARVVLVVAATLAATAGAAPRPHADRAIAFFSGDHPPIEELSWFDDVVVDPERTTESELAALKSRGVAVVARVPRALSSGQQDAGQMALASFDRRGYAGYLVDGRDPNSAVQTDAFVLEIRRRFPQAALYFWGPPERLIGLASVLSGYVTDGIFTVPSPVDGQLMAPAMVDDLEAVRRLAALDEIRDRYSVPFIVTERLPAGQREQARGIARTLYDRGFIPWVTVGGRSLGVGLKESVPRRILAVYDGDEEPDLAATVVHRLAALPLEYLGYAVDYLDVRNPLPAGDLSSRYAGIVTWFADDDMTQTRAYESWILNQLNHGVRIVMLGRPGFEMSSLTLARLGITVSNKRVNGPVTVANTGAMVGYETPAAPLGRNVPNWQLRDGVGEVQVELRDASGQRLTPVFMGNWGGLALDPYVVDRGLQDRARWVIDPFAFFARSLDLEAIPAPDTTTENGRRLMWAHMDGDGFASQAEMPPHLYSGEVIKREILERYDLPITVSIIEGETSSEGIYPKISAKIESVARSIFALPQVEVGSHSFSHPFDWIRAARGETGIDAVTHDPVNLPVANYKYDPTREVEGSIAYIKERLAPPKKPVKVFLWSGAALPGPDAMHEIVAANLINMNGGNCEEPLDRPTLSQVPSLGRYVGGGLQVYAQAQNENVYTNEWSGPFYGFRRVVDMFRFTESPRRLKPINIYYHFFAGTKPASLTALHEVYKWTLEQDINPTVVSEVVPKIEDFHQVTLARRLDGTWDVRNLGTLRTLRLDKRLGWPDLAESTNLAGVNESSQGRYLAVAGNGPVSVALTTSKPTLPYLQAANAALLSWSRDHGRVKFHLKGHVPVEVVLGGCTPSGGASVSGARTKIDGAHKQVRLSFAGHDTHEVSLSCR